MGKITFLILLLTLQSCATKKRTMIYSAIGGAVLGGVLGKALSPDKESDLLNTTMGATLGAAASTGISYLLYNDANPELNLEQVPLDSENKLPILSEDFGMDQIRITPKLIPLGSKEYLKLKGEYSSRVQAIARRQYIKRYQTEAYSFEENGVKFIIPSFEIIVNGVE